MSNVNKCMDCYIDGEETYKIPEIECAECGRKSCKKCIKTNNHSCQQKKELENSVIGLKDNYDKILEETEKKYESSVSTIIRLQRELSELKGINDSLEKSIEVLKCSLLEKQKIIEDNLEKKKPVIKIKKKDDKKSNKK